MLYFGGESGFFLDTIHITIKDNMSTNKIKSVVYAPIVRFRCDNCSELCPELSNGYVFLNPRSQSMYDWVIICEECHTADESLLLGVNDCKFSALFFTRMVTRGSDIQRLLDTTLIFLSKKETEHFLSLCCIGFYDTEV